MTPSPDGHAVGCGFIFLVEVRVHEEGEQCGEAVEGGVGEVLLFLALGGEGEEAALGDAGGEVGTDHHLDRKELGEAEGKGGERLALLSYH